MPAPARPARVLVVEDDDDLRVALCRLLAANGYDVGLAANGVEAIEAVEHQAPCAVVLDLLMPGIVGQELLEHMRSDPDLAAIPVAIISGSPELAPPGYEVFPKPVDHAALLAFVRSACAPAGS
ncbi:MAG TPA: response regulator [Kofleriaceae bacterium]|jgi:CheY-like chemotaxis protein|nr:response regulator [Kofleriaceae bacterium]